MRRTRKPLIAGIALALVAALGVGATLAWLTDEESVTNTFTVGNVDIDLWEHDYVPETGELDMGKEVKANADYKMVPGTVLPKDPTVTIEGGSEDCWLFVKAEKTDNLDSFISYTVDPNNWTKLNGVEGVYWCYAKDVTADRNVKVLLDGQVKVKDTVTKEMMDALEADGATLPQLTFTAYAVQMAGFDTAEAAWSATFGA